MSRESRVAYVWPRNSTATEFSLAPGDLASNARDMPAVKDAISLTRGRANDARYWGRLVVRVTYLLAAANILGVFLS